MEDLDVVTEGMNASLDTATASQMPEEQVHSLFTTTAHQISSGQGVSRISSQVEELIRRVADEHSLEVDQLLSDAGSVGTRLPAESTGVAEAAPAERPGALAM